MAYSRTDTQADQKARRIERLAINGGTPVRKDWLPYGRQSVTDSDITAVVNVLKSDWLTQGPTIADFEREVAAVAGAKYAVAFSNGTAGLHGAYFSCGIAAGDEIITSGMTFAATANAALYLGAIPRFADIDPNTGNIDPKSVEKLINEKTRAIVGVDYAGHPCQLDELRAIAQKHSLFLIEDAAHALGAEYKGCPVGSISDLSVFSFHPVKAITTAEGGMVTTNDENLAHRLRNFRTHGIEKDPAFLDEAKPGPWYYEIQELGFNYRLTDIQAALGVSQLTRLPQFIERRGSIAKRYLDGLSKIPGVLPLAESAAVKSARHLFPILVQDRQPSKARERLVRSLHAENIGVQVHYIPVYRHPLYMKLFGDAAQRCCPRTEEFYERVLSLPLFPAMTNQDADDVLTALEKVLPECLTEIDCS